MRVFNAELAVICSDASVILRLLHNPRPCLHPRQNKRRTTTLDRMLSGRLAVHVLRITIHIYWRRASTSLFTRRVQLNIVLCVFRAMVNSSFAQSKLCFLRSRLATSSCSLENKHGVLKRLTTEVPLREHCDLPVDPQCQQRLLGV